MNETTIQIDRAGRIVLPKRLRDRFHLRGGDTLTIEVRNETIELRPAQSASRLERVNGVLVFTGEVPLQAGEDLVDQSREERIDQLMHGTKVHR